MRRLLLATLLLAGCAPDDGSIYTIVGSGVAGLGGEAVAPEDAELYIPMDAVPTAGGAFVMDWNNNRIRFWDREADLVTTVIGAGLSGDGPDGVLPTESRLNHTTDITEAPDGRLLVADWHNHRLKWVTPGLRIEAAYGLGEPDFGGDGGPAEDASFRYPVTVRYAPDGALIVADQGNNRVRRVDPETGLIDTIVGTGLGASFDELGEGERCIDANPQGVLDCFNGDGGPATEATLNNTLGQSGVPMGRLEVAEDGSLVIADTKNHVVRRVDAATGVIETVAGVGGSSGFEGDGGDATLALLDSPHDVALADDGSVYIADTENHCVRVLLPDGTLTTAAGVCGTSGYDGDGGPPEEALLNAPYGVAVDGDLVLIIDSFNHVVRGFQR